MSAGILAMAGTAFLWSIAGLFIKVIDWNPIAIAGSRSLIASIIIFIYLKHPKIHLSFPQIAAAVANAATTLLFVSAKKTTTAANAIILQYFASVASIISARRSEEVGSSDNLLKHEAAGLSQGSTHVAIER